MSMVIDQQHGFKHFCKVCKKGFGCGRALGGHMRAHGLGDDHGSVDYEEGTSDYDDKFGGTHPPVAAVNKRMYALRTNPNRFKSCRNCDNCGKEFSSWKSFLEHGKCSLDLPESLPESDDADGRKGYGWFKGKRSRRAKMVSLNSNCLSSEEEDLANCLMLLSAARVDLLVPNSEESCASDSKDEVSRDSMSAAATGNWISGEKAKSVKRGLFECKACKKVFTSHQALGGHRASHKKVKGCFAARLDGDHDENLIEDDVNTHEELSLSSKSLVLPLEGASRAPSNRKKVHECSICHRIFASGQALGGHKRCHWITSNSPEPVAKLNQLEEHGQQLQLRTLKFDKPKLLDLNLPAPADELIENRLKTDGQVDLEVSTEMYLKPYLGSNLNGDFMVNVDDEEESRKKHPKLSDLKEMSLGGGPWLQVGIGSTANGNNEQ